MEIHSPDSLGAMQSSTWTVKYKDLDYAVDLSLRIQKEVKDLEFQGLYYGKTDLSSAFRILPLRPDCFCLLVMKARDPETGKWWYFIDKCLPFGSSRSCALFQKFSDSLQFMVEFFARKKRSVSNYLDDFLFIAATIQLCNYLLSTFLDICKQINCPVSEEKMVWAMQMITFLGILLDGRNMLLALPADKCDKAKKMLQWMLSKKSATVKELQRLTGILNFLTKAIFAGRVFTKRMYAKCSNLKNKQGFKLKEYHHVKLDQEFKGDCWVWIRFRENTHRDRTMLCRPYVDIYSFESAVTLQFTSDAAKKEGLGFGAFFDRHWLYSKWEKGFMAKFDPSIEYLELFAVCAGIFTWAHHLRNCRIIIFCDNQSVVSMINNTTSSCKNCMVLLRMLVLNGLVFNRKVLVRYISSKDNILSDALSRQRLNIFWKNAPNNMFKTPEQIPAILWPLSKLWVHQ